MRDWTAREARKRSWRRRRRGYRGRRGQQRLLSSPRTRSDGTLQFYRRPMYVPYVSESGWEGCVYRACGRTREHATLPPDFWDIRYYYVQLQGDPSGWLIVFVDTKFKVDIRSLYCDGTFVLMSTKADGSPCTISNISFRGNCGVTCFRGEEGIVPTEVDLDRLEINPPFLIARMKDMESINELPDSGGRLNSIWRSMITWNFMAMGKIVRLLLNKYARVGCSSMDPLKWPA